jgi:hypothetical protein
LQMAILQFAIQPPHPCWAFVPAPQPISSLIPDGASRLAVPLTAVRPALRIESCK